MNSLKEKLADLRTQIGAISKNKENPFFNSQYFDINELLKQLQPHLDERGLLLTQPIRDGKVQTVIEDLESDESRISEITLPDINDPQKLGSAITYYRRYTLQSLLGLQAEDDDGNKASSKSSGKKRSRPDDKKDWLNEGSDEWVRAEKAVKGGEIKASELRDWFKVSNSNMEYFESLEP